MTEGERARRRPPSRSPSRRQRPAGDRRLSPPPTAPRTRGHDYVAPAGTLIFAPGRRRRPSPSRSHGDPARRGDERFSSTSAGRSTRRSPTARARARSRTTTAPGDVDQRRDGHRGQHRNRQRQLHDLACHSQRAAGDGRGVRPPTARPRPAATTPQPAAVVDHHRPARRSPRSTCLTARRHHQQGQRVVPREPEQPGQRDDHRR